MRFKHYIFLLIGASLSAFLTGCPAVNPVEPGMPITPSRTPTFTPTVTGTLPPTDTPSFTPSFTPTITATLSPTGSATATPSFTASFTPSNTPSPTATFTLTDTPTHTATFTLTHTPTHTATFTPTNCSFFGGKGSGSQPQSGPNHAMCSSFTLSTLATVKALRVRLNSNYTGFDVNLAIYDNVSGNPGNLIIQGTPQAMVVGDNILPLPDTPLNPGTYWLAVKTSSDLGLICDEAQSGTIKYRLFDPWNGGNFLSSFSANYTDTYFKVSVSADYCVEPATTPPPTATHTFTPTPTFTWTMTPTLTPLGTPTFTSTPCGVSGTLGDTSSGGTGTGNPNFFVFSSFTAPASGTLRQARVEIGSDPGGKIQVLLYDNAGGYMNNLVASSPITTFASTFGPGFLYLPLPNAPITVGQTYHLGVFVFPVPPPYPYVSCIYDHSGYSTPACYIAGPGTVTNPASFGSPVLISPSPLRIFAEFCQ